MVSTDRLLAFAAMSFLLIVIPGPSVLFVIGRALAQGRRAALATVAGNTLGSCVLAVAVALGVGAVVERSVLVFTVLKLAGAAYLVYLGIRAVRQRGTHHGAEASPSSGAVDGPGGGPGPGPGQERGRGGLRRTVWEGFAVGVANPKTIVFFAAVLPQFVDRGQGYAALQMMLLGLVFNVIAVSCDSVWGLAAAAARSWFARSPRRLALIGGAGGFAMIGLGVTVAATGRKE
ncbi:LysE family translocator [Streptomyces sp. WAC 00631]|uniref:LysE family translocator n=1 Tax=Streptomyces sp. WAC 00631 TaxID=2203201 RepID=UPI000F7A3E79|nr:LysE family translocator [Streptomyces sp. WAC 00631]MCC5032000.1 LysE family translocator [Streptomyces sp. WAC 00631]